MTTDWNLPEVAAGYEDYDPIRERILAYPAIFAALGLGRPECKTVLDYGCGTGRVAELITESYDVSVIAADISTAMLAVARRERSHPRISYQRIGTDRRIEVAPDSVDAALSSFVFVTITDVRIIRAIVEEVFRTL